MHHLTRELESNKFDAQTRLSVMNELQTKLPPPILKLGRAAPGGAPMCGAPMRAPEATTYEIKEKLNTITEVVAAARAVLASHLGDAAAPAAAVEQQPRPNIQHR